MGLKRNRGAKSQPPGPDSATDDGAQPDTVEAGAPDGTADDEAEDEEVMEQLAPLPPPKVKRRTGRFIAQCLLRHGESTMQPGSVVTGFGGAELAELEKQGHVVAEMN
jgi:hypothetical protein